MRNTRRFRAILAVLFILVPAVLVPKAHTAPLLQVGSFLGSPSHFNGFEAIGTDQYGSTFYSEGGIGVSYVGTPTPAARLVAPALQTGPIWTTWTNHIGGEGGFGWYGPGFGYTAIRLESGGEMEAVQFLAGSGWGYVPDPATFMQYQLLRSGSVVLSGVVEILAGNCSTAGWARGEPCDNGPMGFFGFSGGGFDEVRLQNRGSANDGFSPVSFDAIAIDSIAINARQSVPEPSTLILVVVSLALLALARWGGVISRSRYGCGIGRVQRHHLRV